MARRSQKFDNGTGAEVGSADAYHDEYVAAFSDLFGCFFDPVIFRAVVFFGKREPAEHFGAGARSASQRLVGSLDLGLYCLKFLVRNKRRYEFFTQIKSHSDIHLS